MTLEVRPMYRSLRSVFGQSLSEQTTACQISTPFQRSSLGRVWVLSPLNRTALPSHLIVPYSFLCMHLQIRLCAWLECISYVQGRKQNWRAALMTCNASWLVSGRRPMRQQTASPAAAPWHGCLAQQHWPAWPLRPTYLYDVRLAAHAAGCDDPYHIW